MPSINTSTVVEASSTTVEVSGENRLPRVTVIMAVYNAARFLRRSVESVLSQTFADFELIVVDDASVDNSLAILESFQDPRILIIKHTNNLGASISRNHALERARGEFIAIMDADDICSPFRLERQVQFLEQNPKVGLVGCAIYDNIDSEGAILHTSVEPQSNFEIQRTLMHDWCLLHSSVMFRRSHAEQVGGYRGSYEPIEDHDFVLRVAEHCEIHNLAENLVSYRLNPRGLTVAKHQHIAALRRAAILAAEQRRTNKSKDEAPEFRAASELTHGVQSNPGGSFFRVFGDSYFAASRYYVLGCHEFRDQRTAQAIRCFRHSARTNFLFIKAWVALAACGCAGIFSFVKSRLAKHHRPGQDRENLTECATIDTTTTHLPSLGS